MVLPGPLVKSMLQDLLGAVALCHDRNIVIKAIDAEKVLIISCFLFIYWGIPTSNLSVWFSSFLFVTSNNGIRELPVE